MLRWLFFLQYPEGVPKEAGERWYLETHAREAAQLGKLRRYRSWETQKARLAPPWTTTGRLNRWDRVTELVFDNWEDWHDAAVVNVPDYTPPGYGPRGFLSESGFFEEEPTNDLLSPAGSAPGTATPDTDSLVRWLFILRYPESVPYEAGESWYLGTHTQEAKHMAGLRRYVSWVAQHPPEGIQAPVGSWNRLTELAFADWAAWEEGAVMKMPQWTPPPYGNPGFLSETAFVRELPDHDFLAQKNASGARW